ncbi:MAG TPA: PIG-L family deacetylase [Thermoanaerobaculia bacterium]|nr:PIG-L family deacetylase [Thermoanaerobaculia bacterium]
MNENMQPPGWTERVRAERVLIVAPHYDDEVLGCGGLAAQLAASGTVVRVLFLTDGSGGAEEIEDRNAYRERRRQEAEQAVNALGAEGCDSLGIPDGALDRHLREAEQGLREALLSQRPDLLLIPHPLEVTRDHQAAFAAVHRLLAPVRDGDRDEMVEALRGVRILLYEVNHPGHPDLLVDVTAEQEVLESAMAVYTSQEERHPYLNAALGLRRFRTLSLGPEVKLAEGYRRLRVDDFTTRSPAQLIRHLGGFPEVAEVREGPKVSVIVRTRNRPDLLAEALASLAEGQYRHAEVVLVNDGGDPPAIPADYPLPVMRIDLEQNRGRAGAAEAGIAAVTGDFVAFLDDDDLAAPEHLATLAGMVQAPGVRVAYTDAAVAIYELDEQAGRWICRDRRLPYSRDFDPDVLLVDNYIPFNTLLIDRRLFAEVGPFDPSLPFFEDWDYLIRLSARTPFHHARKVTCEYRHFRGGSHHIFGERPRERGDFLAVKARVLAKHASRIGPDVLARAVDTLRNELVNEREDRATARRELAGRESELLQMRADLDGLARAHDALSRERFALEERYFALNGELDAQRKDSDCLRSALQRLYDEEQTLRDNLDEQNSHLGRTYAEIERLNGIIRQMETTRAWRLHQWVQERKRK